MGINILARCLFFIVFCSLTACFQLGQKSKFGSDGLSNGPVGNDMGGGDDEGGDDAGLPPDGSSPPSAATLTLIDSINDDTDLNLENNRLTAEDVTALRSSLLSGFDTEGITGFNPTIAPTSVKGSFELAFNHRDLREPVNDALIELGAIDSATHACETHTRCRYNFKAGYDVSAWLTFLDAVPGIRVTADVSYSLTTEAAAAISSALAPLITERNAQRQANIAEFNKLNTLSDIYLYFTTAKNYVYSLSPHLNVTGYQGLVMKAYSGTNAPAGVVPVYQLLQNGRYIYRTSTVSGWTNTGIVFYAFPTARDLSTYKKDGAGLAYGRTVPVYELTKTFKYNNKDVTGRYYYPFASYPSTYDQGLRNLQNNGWKVVGPVFWIPFP